MAGTIKIKVQEVYEWCAFSSEFRGCVKIFLPADQYGRLKEKLQSAEHFLGSRLTSVWGELVMEDGYYWRVKESEGLFDKDFNNLTEKVKQKVNECIEQLKRIVEENRKNFAKENLIEYYVVII